jgi:putative DNA-invertase from lambdoid prophage Rac
MIYGYIRVSTDKQTTENQRFEILKFAHEKKLSIDRWIEETVSSTRKLSDRKLGHLIEARHWFRVMQSTVCSGFKQWSG